MFSLTKKLKLVKGNIIKKHHINFCCYADDTQLYLSIHPDDTTDAPKLQECLKDIKNWTMSNLLLLNSDKKKQL